MARQIRLIGKMYSYKPHFDLQEIIEVKRLAAKIDETLAAFLGGAYDEIETPRKGEEVMSAWMAFARHVFDGDVESLNSPDIIDQMYEASAGFSMAAVGIKQPSQES